ncbi:MAG: hypothetical protein OCD00_14855 [Colwellia sp.]
MKYILSIALLFTTVCLPAKAQQTCQITQDLLGAHYRLMTSQGNNKQAENELKTIWRAKHKVLSVNGEQSTTWFKSSHNLVQKTAHFDHFKRSIEYQAKPMTDERWQQLWQFMPNSQRKSLTLTGSRQEGCWQQEVYQWQNEKKDLLGKLVWNASLQLVTSLTLTQGERQSHWQLEKIESDEKVILQAFKDRADYQATDFADIGDNESDPFLIKMINLGFIEHGASGFYNSNGEIISANHHHK